MVLAILVVGVLLLSGITADASGRTATPVPGGPLVASAGLRPAAAVLAPAHHVAAAIDSPQAMAWGQLSGNAPPDRIGAGFTSLPGSGLGVLYGGHNRSGLLADTLVYIQSVKAANQWSTITPGPTPGARSDFGFASDLTTNTAVLFGGVTDLATNAVTNTTWSFSFPTETWAPVTTNAAPPAREDVGFAVGDGIALLYGGWNQNFQGVGEVIYSDTWELNLTTSTWTRVTTPGLGAPGPLQGASLLWDSNLSVFHLFGGCYPCTNALWTFNLTTQNWTPVSPAGTPPVARMDSVFAWDPVHSVALLFGGTGGGFPLRDTFLYNPVDNRWTREAPPSSPPAVSAAAAAYIALSGNDSLLMTGGLALGGVPQVGSWRLASVSQLTLLVTNGSSKALLPRAYARVGVGPIQETGANGTLHVSNVPSNETTINASAPGFYPFNENLWIPPAVVWTLWINMSVAPTAVVFVNVTDPLANRLAGAFVNLSVQGAPVAGSPHQTDSFGEAVFTGVPAFGGSVNASRSDFHLATVPVVFPPGGTLYVTVVLTPDLEIAAHTEGILASGPSVALSGVPIVCRGVILGATSASGWLNVSTNLSGPAVITASDFGFLPARLNVTLGYTGIQYANLTLMGLPYPVVTVTVLEAGSRAPIQNADVNVSSVSLTPGSIFDENLHTGAVGTVTLSPPPGNYTISAWAPGFAPNTYPGLLYAPPSVQLPVTIVLTPLPFATFDVQVVSTAGVEPAIYGANVTLSYLTTNLTTGKVREANSTLVTPRDGWANFTGLPGTTLIVSGSAFGYYTNITTTQLRYGEHVTRYVLHLTPIPQSPGQGPAPGEALSILPPGVASLWALILLPILALAGALVYLTTLRTPPRRPSGAASFDTAPLEPGTVEVRGR